MYNTTNCMRIYIGKFTRGSKYAKIYVFVFKLLTERVVLECDIVVKHAVA